MSTQTASNKDLSSSLGDIFSSKPSSPSSNTYEPGSPFSSGSSDSSDVSSMASGTSWQTILIIILILALLGFNIFIYLAKGTGAVAEFIDKYFGPLLKLFGISILETTKQTIDVSATGTKAGVDAVANTATGAIDVLEQGTNLNPNTNTSNTTSSNTNTNTSNTSNTSNSSNTSNTSNSSNTSNKYSGQQASGTQKNSMPVQQQIQQDGSVSEWRQDTLDSALNDASKNPEPQPDESSSSVQSTGKAGWCYIGMDRNTRTCSQVGVNDLCMSGDIFPSQDICMNPSLRA
jgi:hypothetical protein